MKPTELITPPARLAFPALFEPKPRFQDQGRMTYQATLLLPPDTDLSPFANAIKAMMQEEWKEQIKLPGDSNPIHKCEDKATQPDGYEDGWFYISTHTGYRPGVVDQKRKPIYDAELAKMNPEEAARQAEERVFAGCWCRFHLNTYAWEFAGKKGVSFNLNAVQLLREDSRLDGRAEASSVFDEVEVEGDEAPVSDSDVENMFG